MSWDRKRRRMTSPEIRKLSFLPLCQRSERRSKERKMEHNCDDEKRKRMGANLLLSWKKNLYIK